MKIHHKNHNSEYYYTIRATNFETSTDKAAKFLYLNRTCWNGLYRVNRAGQFNVPIGTKTKVFSDDDDFLGASKILSTAEIICSDFEKIIDTATAEDFIFIDPPYTVRHNNNNFIKYNKELFSWSDQVRLFESIKRAVYRKAYILLTNADHPSVVSLFSSLGRYISLSRHSVLSGKTEGRRRTTEALFIYNVHN